MEMFAGAFSLKMHFHTMPFRQRWFKSFYSLPWVTLQRKLWWKLKTQISIWGLEPRCPYLPLQPMEEIPHSREACRDLVLFRWKCLARWEWFSSYEDVHLSLFLAQVPTWNDLNQGQLIGLFALTFWWNTDEAPKTGQEKQKWAQVTRSRSCSTVLNLDEFLLSWQILVSDY